MSTSHFSKCRFTFTINVTLHSRKCQLGVLPCWMLSSERPENILIISEKDHEIYVNHFIQIGSMSAVSNIESQWLTPSLSCFASQLRVNFSHPSAAYSLAAYTVTSFYPESAMGRPYQLRVRNWCLIVNAIVYLFSVSTGLELVPSTSHDSLASLFAKMETSCAGKTL